MGWLLTRIEEDDLEETDKGKAGTKEGIEEEEKWESELHESDWRRAKWNESGNEDKGEGEKEGAAEEGLDTFELMENQVESEIGLEKGTLEAMRSDLSEKGKTLSLNKT